MTDSPWWQTGVVYQIYPRSFKDHDGDGVGDLRGICEKLDYLNDGSEGSLGVDAIWLSPVYPSPQKDFGYDVADYCAIDPVFGTMADFDTLVKEARRRKIRIVMDWVVNHTSDQHPWFTASRSSKTDPKRDWYMWHEGVAGRPPNNWGSVFGGSAWCWEETSKAFYLHSFAREQPDLNWRNPEVRDAIWDAMRFWLDRGVSGFRLDVCNCYLKDVELRSNPRTWNPAGLLHPFIGQKHIHDRDHRDLLPAFEEMRAALGDDPERMLVGEVMDERLRYRWAPAYCGTPNRGLHLAFNFELLHSRWGARSFGAAIRRWHEALPEGWPTWVLSNHDFKRQRSRCGDGTLGEDRAKLLAIMLLTLRGAPYLYYGEELGMREGRLRYREIQDPPGKRFWPLFKGRDGCRTPMQWSAENNAGFSPGRPWLRVNPDYRVLNVEAQNNDPKSLLNVYRRLIWLRKRQPALRHGSMTLPPKDDRQILTWLRRAGDAAVRVVMNLSGRSCVFVVPPGEKYRVLFATHDRDIAAGSRLVLRPAEGLVLAVGTDTKDHSS